MQQSEANLHQPQYEQELLDGVRLPQPPSAEIKLVHVDEQHSISVIYRHFLDKQAFLQYYEMAESELSSLIDQAIRSLINGLSEAPRQISSVENELFFLAQIHYLRSSLKTPYSEVVTDVKTFISYIQEQLGIAVSPAFAMRLSEALELYQSEYLSCYKLRVVHTEAFVSTGLQSNDVTWRSYEKVNGGYLLVDERIAQLAELYLGDPHIMSLIGPSQDKAIGHRYFKHDTNQRVLEGVAQHQALLSAAKLNALGEQLLGGEAMETPSSEQLLMNVHASLNAVSSGFVTTQHFFGDEQVTIIIDEIAQMEVLRKQYQESQLSKEEIETRIAKKLRQLPRWEPVTMQELVHVPESERRKYLRRRIAQRKQMDSLHVPRQYESYLGPIVPLHAVRALAVPDELIDAYKPWVEKNLPAGAKILVREAAELANLFVRKLVK